MKPVEEVFASGVFRRVILPGIILSAGLHPLISSWRRAVADLYGFDSTIFIIIEIVVLGLAISSGVQWIYYIYEGFRAELLTRIAGRRNSRRLAQYQTRNNEIFAGRDFEALSASKKTEVTKIYEHLSDYPLRFRPDGSVEHFAERPTRLGNVIATYELYAETRYGIDGNYFWNHLLNFAPAGTRKAFDDVYSFAESLVLASFAGVLVATVHLLVLFGFALGALFPSWILFHLPFGPTPSAWLAVFGVLVWLLFYEASIPTHRDVGTALRAIIDCAMPSFIKWASTMKVPLPAETVTHIKELNEYLENLDRRGADTA